MAHSQIELNLSELLATQPRRRRGTLAPGERFPTGMRPGRRRAQGVDLDSIGPYVVGDDLRFMDWRATARTGRAQMKRFVAESHVARMLVVDLRPHMFFATREHPMAKTAALIASRIAWEAFALHEPIGLIAPPYAEPVVPRRGRAQVLRILDSLVDLYAKLRPDVAHADDVSVSADGNILAGALESAAECLRRGDAINIISDFGGDLGPLVSSTRGLAGLRAVRAIVVEDAITREPLRPGRYPMRTPDGTRHTASLSGAMLATQATEQMALRDSRRRELQRAGMRVSDVSSARYLAEG